MSDPFHKRPFLWLAFGSLAANIFLIGYLAGHDLPGPFHHHGGPPPWMHDGDMPPPPPPPFFAGALFTPDELDDDRPIIEQHFKKVDALRTALLEQLEAGKFSPGMVQKNFDATEAVMDDLRGYLQKKAIDKISHMTPEERKDFANELRESMQRHWRH